MSIVALGLLIFTIAKMKIVCFKKIITESKKHLPNHDIWSRFIIYANVAFSSLPIVFSKFGEEFCFMQLLRGLN